MTGFTLRQLAYFIGVADAGTIVAAAVALNVSPSAVSASLRDLERVLDAQLCVRRKAHGVSLTPTGARFLIEARELIARADLVGMSVASSSGELVGSLTIGCYLTLSPTVLPRLLETFARENPLVVLNFVEGTQDDLQRRLAAGEMDLLVLYDMDVVDDPHRVVLYRALPYVLLPAEHARAQKGSVQLSDLIVEPFILLDSPPSSHHTLTVFESQGLLPLVRHRSASYELARALVGRGLGYSVLVQRPSNDVTYEGRRIVAVEIDPAPAGVDVILIWMRDARLSRPAQAMVALARAEFGPSL
jgi:DNA-binding transcriptional LysR family regulator